jgi:PII-like signaling protein
VLLLLIVSENSRNRSQPLHEWLLTTARELGIDSGGVFKPVSGFDAGGTVHFQVFWELGGKMPLEVRLLCSESQAERLLTKIEEANPQPELTCLVLPARLERFGLKRLQQRPGRAAGARGFHPQQGEQS